MDKLEANCAIEYNSRLICQLFVTKNMHNIKIEIEECSYGEHVH